MIIHEIHMQVANAYIKENELVYFQCIKSWLLMLLQRLFTLVSFFNSFLQYQWNTTSIVNLVLVDLSPTLLWNKQTLTSN